MQSYMSIRYRKLQFRRLKGCLTCLQVKVKFSLIRLYEGFSSEEIPGEINVYDTRPVLIDADMGTSFEENLAEKGWKEHEFEATDIPGLYFIGSKKRGDLFDNNEDFDAAAEDFMQDSGLFDYVKALGMGVEGELQGRAANAPNIIGLPWTDAKPTAI